MKRTALLAAVVVAACQSPPPPVPAPVGKPVAWPRPAPRKAPAPVAKVDAKPSTKEVEPSAQPDRARPTEDDANPGEVIQQSERAQENATSYVLGPGARTVEIDRLTVLARNVIRAREAMERGRAATGQYSADDVEALRRASDLLDQSRPK